MQRKSASWQAASKGTASNAPELETRGLGSSEDASNWIIDTLENLTLARTPYLLIHLQRLNLRLALRGTFTFRTATGEDRYTFLYKWHLTQPTRALVQGRSVQCEIVSSLLVCILACHSENHFMNIFNICWNFTMIDWWLVFSSVVNESKLTYGYISKLDPQHIKSVFALSFPVSPIGEKCNFSILQDMVKLSHLGDVYIIKIK